MSFEKIYKGGISFAFTLLLGVAITACGGDGGDNRGGGSSSNQGVQSSGAASKAVINALGAAQEAGAGDSSTSSFKAKTASESNLSDAAKIRLGLEAFKSSLSQRQQKVFRAPDPQQLPCTSGSGTITPDNQDTPDSADDTLLITADNCVMQDPTSGVTTLLNGSLSILPNQNGFILTFNNFLSRETDASGRIEESQTNGTLEFVGEDEGCGAEVFLKNGTLTANNLTNTERIDGNADGIFEVDETSTMTGFTLNVVEQHAPADQGCTPGATTLTLNGTSSFTNALEANDNFTATFNGFQMVLTPSTRTIDNVEKEGVTMALSGSVAIDSECADGTFTVSTPENDLPFIPDDEECAVQGRMLVSDGTNTTAVIATSTGGVQIDNGNNGSVDREFSDCNEAEACAENA